MRSVTWGALALGLVLSLTACSGESPPAAGPPSSARSARSAGAQDPAAVRERAQTCYETFAGTVADHEALDVLSSYRNNGGVAECLAARGHPGWDWAALAYAGPQQDALASDPPWAAAPHRGWWSSAALASAAFRRAEIEADNPTPDPALDPAVDACSGTRPERLAEARGHVPARVRELPSTWADAVGRAVASLGRSATYLACMTDQDIPLLAGRPFEPYSRRVEGLFEAALPAPDQVPVGDEAPSAAWTRYLALEAQFTDADWVCREPSYAEAMAAVAPLIDEFATEHAADVHRATAYWTRVRHRAVALGWDPTTGAVDLSVVA